IFPRTWNPHKYLQGKKYHSSNIIAFVPAKTYGNDGHRALFDDVFDIETYKTEIDLGLEKGSTPSDEKEEIKYGNIIISAHSDSKSQKYTTDVRVRIFRAAVISEIFFLFLWLITVIMGVVIETAHIFTYTQIPALLITIDLAFFTIFLFKNSSGNESFGALDNATGMASVFAMADYFNKRPLERFNLWFIQFGVEEFGQWGAANFVLKNLRHFKRGRTFNFNLDMVGSKEDDKLQILEFYGLFKKPVNPFLMSFINESADELGIELLGFNLPTGARTDRVIFTRYGFDGIDFASANAAKWTHRPEDMIDKVNPQMIQHACRIISLSAQKMDEALKKDILEEPREARFQHRGYH
ncbi:MAG: Zn-dependent exopeptidase M28, partial [archaeon]|nr:Zn-dependent exopeptidase M28 [archaeon]